MISTFGWKFQRWRQASLWIKFEDKELEALFEEDQSQTQEELAESLRVTQQAVSVRLRAGNDSKTRKLGALWTEETRETLKGDFSLANSWFKDNKEKVFCIGLWLEMRSGYSMTTSRRKNITLSPVNRCHRPQHQHHSRTFMIRRKLYIWWNQKNLVYCKLLKPGDFIMAIGIGYNWFVWAVHCEKNGRNTNKDMIKFFFTTTLGLMSLKS